MKRLSRIHILLEIFEKWISQNIVFYIFITCLLLQSTFFFYRAWTLGNFVFFTLCSMFYSLLATILISWTKSKLLKILLYTIPILLCTTNIFLYLQFSTKISPNILLLLGETNQQESRDFINSHLISRATLISLLILFSLIYIITLLEKRQHLQTKKIPNYILIALLLCSFAGLPPTVFFYYTLNQCVFTTDIDAWMQNNDLKPMDNFSNLLYSIYDINVMGNEMNMALEQTLHMKGNCCLGKDSLSLILVVGESYNKWHSQLYGYQLRTTPKLERERQKGNLFVFSNVITPYNLTSMTLRNLFSTNSLGEGEKWYEMPFLPAIFHQAGYETSLWDNQYNPLSREEWDFSLNSYLHHPKLNNLSYTYTNKQIYNLDGDLIKDYAIHKKTEKKKRNFIIFHLMGQHFSYYSRFPHGDSFDYFNADSIYDTNRSFTLDQKQIIADYNNATRYNDYVIGEIINMFNNENAILIYVPDHGEEVYDYRDFYGRSWEKNISAEIIKYQYEIPFMIWCSNKYITNHSQIIRLIESAQAKPFSIDNISHLLIRLGDVQSPYYNSERDLIDSHYKCPSRVINDSIIYDDYIHTNTNRLK